MIAIVGELEGVRDYYRLCYATDVLRFYSYCHSVKEYVAFQFAIITRSPKPSF